jgi:hypothetical protein
MMPKYRHPTRGIPDSFVMVKSAMARSSGYIQEICETAIWRYGTGVLVRWRDFMYKSGLEHEVIRSPVK